MTNSNKLLLAYFGNYLCGHRSPSFLGIGFCLAIIPGGPEISDLREVISGKVTYSWLSSPLRSRNLEGLLN